MKLACWFCASAASVLAWSRKVSQQGSQHIFCTWPVLARTWFGREPLIEFILSGTCYDRHVMPGSIASVLCNWENGYVHLVDVGNVICVFGKPNLDKHVQRRANTQKQAWTTKLVLECMVNVLHLENDLPPMPLTELEDRQSFTYLPGLGRCGRPFHPAMVCFRKPTS